ncbi:hypothetical protein [Nocardioides daejeonensis]|uniref:hypothetical protein n=1 Tax=Nocardioides daejeonensis TaxID=1046556 RepID=UPI000D746D54|nr:hypothetical protein [Nocardioides daejeonensis]
MAKEDLAAVHQELELDHVYVHPSLRSLVSESDEESLQQQAAQADHPTYIVVWPYRPGDAYGGKPADLLTRLHDQYPEPGIYLSNEVRLEPIGDSYGVEIDGRQWGVGGEQDGPIEWRVKSQVGMERQPDVVTSFERGLELLAMDPGDLEQLHGTTLDERSATYRAEHPPEDEGGWQAPVVTGLVALLALFVAWRVVVSFRKQKQPAPLPKSAMQRIRAAQSKELLARAQDESQALGELLDELEISPHDDRSAWQAALDHYAAVRRLLESEEPDPLDVVGALVLTQRGEDALSSARAGQPWEPSRTCFLNPLHGKAAREQRIEVEGRLIDVPVCAACRTALRKKQVPDIFDVVRRGQPRHYFETDVEPWASSGYGALDPDLLKLLTRPRH